MADYIDREALLKDIEESVVFSVRAGHISPERRGANKITDRIKSALTADAVEVVRCKECKFVKLMSDEKTLACIRQSAYKKPMDFCSYGERKDAECQ